MAIVLQSEPANEMLAATLDSNELGYVVDIDVNTGSPTRPDVDSVLEVEYWVGGVLLNTEQYNVNQYTYLGGNIHQYRFSFDAQENVQAYFKQNADTILDLFRPLQSSSANPSYVGQFYLLFREYNPNADDLLEPNPTTQVSSTRTAINAVIRHEDEQSLNAFDNVVLGTDAEWLTEKPETMRLLCRDDDEQIGGWNMHAAANLVGMTFTGYNALGVSISVGAMNNIPAAANGITVFPVGPQNIINATGWTLTPLILPSNPIMKSYQVKISTANRSVAYRVWLKDACCTKYRFYFRNRFGLYDTFDIEGMDVQSYQVESTTYEQVRGGEYSPTKRGETKIISIGQNAWEMSKIRLTQAESQWLKQFVMSNMVYMQTAQYSGSSGLFLRPVRIEDAVFKLFNNIDTPVEFSFKVLAANKDKSQRN